MRNSPIERPVDSFKGTRGVYREHDITLASFAQIDREIGLDRNKCSAADGTAHFWSDAEYAVIRRVIHTTADFEFQQLMHFSNQPFDAAIAAFPAQCPIVTDVSMVAAGIRTVVSKTWRSPISTAVQSVPPVSSDTVLGDTAPYGSTRSAAGMQRCAAQMPNAVFVIGNAPTALLALCDGVRRGLYQPALIVGAPVGFINVVEAKQALAALDVPNIVVSGRKGGSAIAAAILNALIIWTWNETIESSCGVFS